MKKSLLALSLAAVEDGGDENTVSPFTMVDRNSAYMQLMFRYGDLRPICYECPFKSCRSQSDITIADYWGINKLHPEMDDDKGTSMVFVNTNIRRVLAVQQCGYIFKEASQKGLFL